MTRFRLTIAYDGTAFHGWQRQTTREGKALRTVQGVVENALQLRLKQPVNLVGASRTDTGVHALGQTAHFDADCPIPIERLALAINSRLPEDVEIRRAEVADGFDAIRDVVGKRYRYRVYVGEARPLFRRTQVWHVDPARRRLDPDAMNDAAGRLVGTHDFNGFATAGHGRESTIRTITRCAVEPAGEDELHVIVEGNGFLWNMVRIIVGTLVEVGRGHWPASRVADILTAADRQLAGPTAPPQGLCLAEIFYE
mgnify:CR=1 FL=1